MFLIGIIVCTPAEAQRVWYKDCVNASVGWGSPGAVDNYGRFTIPQMSTATQLTFKNEDPGGTYTKTTIDYAIYSVAQKGRLLILSRYRQGNISFLQAESRGLRQHSVIRW